MNEDNPLYGAIYKSEPSSTYTPPLRYSTRLDEEIDDPERAAATRSKLRELGYPRIEWEGGRANYNPLLHIIEAPNIRDVEEEMAHAEQFNQAPLQSAVRTIYDKIRYGEGRPFDPRANRYEEEGTIEHEAHRVIVPRLRKELREGGGEQQDILREVFGHDWTFNMLKDRRREKYGPLMDEKTLRVFKKMEKKK